MKEIKSKLKEIEFYCKFCKTEHNINLNELINEGCIKKEKGYYLVMLYVCSIAGRMGFKTKQEYDKLTPSFIGPSSIEALNYYLWNTNLKFYKIT